MTGKAVDTANMNTPTLVYPHTRSAKLERDIHLLLGGPTGVMSFHSQPTS